MQPTSTSKVKKPWSTKLNTLKYSIIYLWCTLFHTQKPIKKASLFTKFITDAQFKIIHTLNKYQQILPECKTDACKNTFSYLYDPVANCFSHETILPTLLVFGSTETSQPPQWSAHSCALVHSTVAPNIRTLCVCLCLCVCAYACMHNFPYIVVISCSAISSSLCDGCSITCLFVFELYQPKSTTWLP